MTSLGDATRALIDALFDERTEGVRARIDRAAAAFSVLPLDAARISLPRMPNADLSVTGRWSRGAGPWDEWLAGGDRADDFQSFCRPGSRECARLFAVPDHPIRSPCAVLKLAVCHRCHLIGFVSFAGHPTVLAELLADCDWQQTVANALRGWWLGEQTRQVIASGVAAKAEAPLEALVLDAAKALGADYVLAGELLPAEVGRVRTLAMCRDGAIVENFVYDLPGTPCADVFSDGVCFLGQGLIEAYPKDQLAREMGLEAYAGIALRNAAGRPAGILVALFRGPVALAELVCEQLQFFAARAEQELRRIVAEREAELMAALIDHSRDAVLVAAPGGQVTYANAAALTMLGLDPQQALPVPVAGTLPAALAAAVMARLESPLDAPGQRFDAELGRPGGDALHISALLYGVEFGGDARVAAVLRDITQRKLREQWAESERREIERYWNLAGVVLVVVDREARIERINERGCELLGSCEDELVGQDWFDTFVAPERIAEMRSPFERLIETGRVERPEFEAPLVRRDGGRRTVRWRAAPLRDAKGAVTGIIGAGLDVTELREAYRDLKDSRELFANAFHGSPEAMMVTDLETGCLIEVNREFEEISGWPREEAIGRSTLDIGFYENPQDRERVIRAMLDPQGPREFRLRFRRRDGELREGVLTGSRVSINDRPSLVLFGRDITEALRAEAEQQELRAKLLQAQKLEAIGLLAGGIAHDFNNILAAILGFTELGLPAARQAGHPKLGTYLEHIHAAGLRARELVAQLLAFSRARGEESGVVQPVPVVKEVVRLLRSSLPTTLRLDLDIGDEGACARGSPVHIHQVLMNLAINARDATGGAGEIRVRIDRRVLEGQCASCRQPFQGDYVRLAVADSGPGIPEELRGRIFDPFFSTKEVGHGSGLGLSVVHGLVHAHGGHIVQTNEVGGGARFEVLWPATDATAVPGEEEPVRAAPASLEGRVLVVDDEVAVGGFLAEVLRGAGCEVRYCASPLDAVNALQRGEPCDVLLTDLTMPGMTGLELAAVARGARPGLSVILCSGYGRHVEPEAMAEAGIGWTLDKPVPVARLIESVAAALAATSRRPTPGARQMRSAAG